MKSLGLISACVVGLLVIAVPVAAQSYDDTIEGYQATTVQMDIGKMVIVRIGITEWSTDEDRQALWQAFKEGGSPGVGKFLSQQSEKGFVKFPDKTAYKMHYAYHFEKDGKHVVMMATDRPSKAWDLAPTSDTEQANLSLLKLVVDAESGKGEGDMVAAAELVVDKEGKIKIDTVGTQPIRFTKVTRMHKKKR